MLGYWDFNHKVAQVFFLFVMSSDRKPPQPLPFGEIREGLEISRILG